MKLENNILILDIEENKIIQRVLIEGVKSETIKEKILENLFSKDKSPFLIEQINKDRFLILSSLNYLGYYLANVETRFIDNPNNTVDLILILDWEINLKYLPLSLLEIKNLKTEYLEMLLYLKKINFEIYYK